MELGPISPGEKFTLWRRREGISQEAAGKFHGVSRKTVNEWERDKLHTVPYKDVQPSPLEVCFLIRRREGLSAGLMAKTMGVSRFAYLRMERGRGDWKRILNYFKSLGWDCGD